MNDVKTRVFLPDRSSGNLVRQELSVWGIRRNRTWYVILYAINLAINILGYVIRYQVFVERSVRHTIGVDSTSLVFLSARFRESIPRRTRKNFLRFIYVSAKIGVVSSEGLASVESQISLSNYFLYSQ